MRPLPLTPRVFGSYSPGEIGATSDTLARLSLVPEFFTRGNVHIPKTGRYLAQQEYRRGCSRLMPNPMPQPEVVALPVMPTRAEQNGAPRSVLGGVTNTLVID